MATLVLMGAGASYGSAPAGTPPLGRKLFEALEARGGVASKLPREIKKKFKDDFESGMLDYYEFSNAEIMTCLKEGHAPSAEQIKRSVMGFQLDLAQYLAEFSPTPSNVYLDLINTVGTEQVVYASLNYDLLFEQCAERLGFLISYGPRLKSTPFYDKQICLLKPHGSSNFWPYMNGSRLDGCVSVGNVGDDIGSSYVEKLDKEETLHRCRTNDSIAPVMAMYAREKKSRVCHAFIENQQRLWKEALEICQRVFIIGTRVHQADDHIWVPLKQCSAEIVYFGRCEDLEPFDKWKIDHSKARFYPAPFDEAVPIMKKILAT